MKKVLLTLLFCFWSVYYVLGQGCVICTKTASELGQNSARGLNSGILYLAAIPLLFIGTVGFIWYRRNKPAEKQ